MPLAPSCLPRLAPEVEPTADGSRPMAPGTDLQVAGWGATEANTLSTLLLVNDELDMVSICMHVTCTTVASDHPQQQRP